MKKALPQFFASAAAFWLLYLFHVGIHRRASFPEQGFQLTQDAAGVLGHIFDAQLALHGLDDRLDQLIVQLDTQDVRHDLHRVLLELFNQAVVARQLFDHLVNLLGDVLAHSVHLLVFDGFPKIKWLDPRILFFPQSILRKTPTDTAVQNCTTLPYRGIP